MNVDEIQCLQLIDIDEDEVLAHVTVSKHLVEEVRRLLKDSDVRVVEVDQQVFTNMDDFLTWWKEG